MAIPPCPRDPVVIRVLRILRDLQRESHARLYDRGPADARTAVSALRSSSSWTSCPATERLFVVIDTFSRS
jgi:hypothetical protein